MRRWWIVGLVGLMGMLIAWAAYGQSRLRGGRLSGGAFARPPAAGTVAPTPTATPIPPVPPKVGFNTPTIAASPTTTTTFTITPTFTRTPTVNTQPVCIYQSFPVAASADDATLTKVDFANGWPPSGTGGASEVSGDSTMTVLVQGASNTAGMHCAAFSSFTAPCLNWPNVMLREVDATYNAATPAWTLVNLAVNNESTMDYRAINAGFVPWMGDVDHGVATFPNRCFNTYSNPAFWFCITSGRSCTVAADCPVGGATGQASDAVAVDPDVVIYGAEANDSRYPYQTFSCPPPGPSVPYDPCGSTSTTFAPLDRSDPQEYIDQVKAFCDEVHAHNPSILCLYSTMHKQAYVGAVPWTRNWIDELNGKLRQQVPATQVIDFDTNTSQPVDLMMPQFFDNSHAWQRLYTERGHRAAVWLKRSMVSTAGPTVWAETSRWNGVNMRSIGALRFDMTAGGGIPAGYVPQRAQLEIGVQFVGAQYGQLATPTPSTSTVDLQWANAEANNGAGWTITDWPTTVTGNAYSGTFPISDTARRSYIGSTGSFPAPTPGIVFNRYLFELDKPNQLTTANLGGNYAGLFLHVTPDTQPPTDTYYSASFVSYDDPLRSRVDTADASPVGMLHVYSCDAKRLAMVPNAHRAVVEGVGDVKLCAATPTPGSIGAGSNYVCAQPKAAPRGLAVAPFGWPVEIPELGDRIVRCKPGGGYTSFLCRTTPTPGTTRVKVGESGKALAFDDMTDWGVCDTTSLSYLCIEPP